MDFKRLEAFCREVQGDIQSLGAEIDASTIASCEEDMLAMLQSTVTRYAVEKRQLRDQLKGQCEALREEISRKRQLIGEVPFTRSIAAGSNTMNFESDTVDGIVVPPYKPLLDQFMVELEQLNSKVSERSQRRNRLWSSICTMSKELSVTSPSMPDSLSDADIAVYASQEAELSNIKSQRLQRVKTLAANIDSMQQYLGDMDGIALSDQYVRRLDVQAIEELELKFEDTNSIYVQRKAEVENLESHITSLTSALEVPLKLPESSAGGSNDRVAALKHYLDELNQLKLQKLDLFVNNSRARMERLWDELFLDPAQRKAFETEGASEQLLDEMEAETRRLELLAKSDERQHAISLLKKYQQIMANEAKLDEMSHDPGRLARRGFAASLKQEEQLRRFNGKHKPEVLLALSKLEKDWSASHNGETFFVNGKTLSAMLSEEKSKETLTGKRRISAGRKRPMSSEQAKAAKLPSKVRSTLSMPSLNPPRRLNAPSSARDHREAAHRRVANLAARPTMAASAAARAMANRARPAGPPAVPATRQKPGVSIQQPRPNNIPRRPVSRPLVPIKPSRINLPSHTPGRPTMNRKYDNARPKTPECGSTNRPQDVVKTRPVQNQSVQNQTAQNQTAQSQSAPSSQWESEQLQKMQNLEMSYFFETSINDTASSVRQSFDYDRDAF